MPAATNGQVQQWANERTRVRAEQIRALVVAMKDDLASVEDVYTNLTNSPTWDDEREDGPPSLLTASDLLAIHAFIFDMAAAMEGHSGYLVVQSACVRPVL